MSGALNVNARASAPFVESQSSDLTSSGAATGLTLTLLLFLLVTGFGDGVAFGLAGMAGVASPWVFLFPFLLVAITLYLTRGSGPSRECVIECQVILTAMSILITLQAFVFTEINLAGFLQLAAFLAVLLVIQGIFAASPSWLEATFPRALISAHYLLCGYVIAAYVIWQLLHIDISLIRLLDPPDEFSLTFTSFRPIGFGKEPQWTAFALSASYLGVYLLRPAERSRALAALAIAAAVLQSVTLLFFFLLFAAVYLWQSGSAFRQMAAAALLALAMTAQVAFSWDRTLSVFDSNDPSLVQRTSSVSVAWDVIKDSAPLGVGYGNFREVAQYSDPRWNSYLNLENARFYKSDLVILNFTAELGIFAVPLLAWLLAVLLRGGSLLPAAFYALTLVLSGTLLLPSLLVLAAVTGLLMRQQRLQPALISRLRMAEDET